MASGAAGAVEVAAVELAAGVALGAGVGFAAGDGARLVFGCTVVAGAAAGTGALAGGVGVAVVTALADAAGVAGLEAVVAAAFAEPVALTVCPWACPASDTAAMAASDRARSERFMFPRSLPERGWMIQPHRLFPPG
jgi:hypothetical protein